MSHERLGIDRQTGRLTASCSQRCTASFRYVDSNATPRDWARVPARATQWQEIEGDSALDAFDQIPLTGDRGHFESVFVRYEGERASARWHPHELPEAPLLGLPAIHRHAALLA